MSPKFGSTERALFRATPTASGDDDSSSPKTTFRLVRLVSFRFTTTAVVDAAQVREQSEGPLHSNQDLRRRRR